MSFGKAICLDLVLYKTVCMSSLWHDSITCYFYVRGRGDQASGAHYQELYLVLCIVSYHIFTCLVA